MNPETAFWQSIRNHIPGFKQRIETIGKGVPDLYVCWNGFSFWIELKVWAKGAGILLRKEQYAWARVHAVNGGKSFVVAKMSIENTILVIPISLVEVVPYGTQQKYVKVISFEKGTVVTTNQELVGSLKKYLFT